MGSRMAGAAALLTLAACVRAPADPGGSSPTAWPWERLTQAWCRACVAPGEAPEPVDTDVVDTVDPAALGRCVIPAPGSLAALGAITEYHVVDSLSVPVQDPSDGYQGDAIPGMPVTQAEGRSFGTMYRRFGGQEFNQVLDLRSVNGTTDLDAVEVAGVRASPDYDHYGPRFRWSADLDGDGVPEALGQYWLSDAYGASTRLVGWTLPFPASGSMDQVPWTFRNSSWRSQSVLHVSVADWNADGFDDLFVGGDYGPNGRTDGFFAGPFRRDAHGVTDLAEYAFAQITWNSPWAGGSLAAVGDFNGDGAQDLAIAGSADIAAVSVFLGPIAGELDGRSPDMRFEVSYLPSDPYFHLVPFAIGDQNGDGVDDLALSDPYADDPRGAVYIFLGPVVRGATVLDTEAWARIRWVHDGALTGQRVVPLGDVDGDGRSDLLVSANAMTALEPAGAVPMAPLPPGVVIPEPPDPPQDTGAGAPAVGPEGALMIFTHLSPGDLGPADAALVVKGSQPGTSIGSSVSYLNDVDGDGLADVMFGAINLEGPHREVRFHVLHPCRDFGVRVPGP